MGEFNNQFYLKVKQIQALSKKSTRETYLNYFRRVNETVKTVIKDVFHATVPPPLKTKIWSDYFLRQVLNRMKLCIALKTWKLIQNCYYWFGH